MSYQELRKKIDEGIEGKNTGIPLCLPKTSKFITGIQKQIYLLLGATTGVGKTALIDYLYVLKPYEWWYENKDKTDIKLHWIYNSMERNKVYKLAKWTCVRLYEKYGILMDVSELLGWEKTDRVVEIKDALDECEVYFTEMLKHIDIYENAENPTGIWNKLIAYALNNGHVEQVSEFKKEYRENDPNLITFIVNDHIGKLKRERGFTVKETIDKHSEYMGLARDFYKFNPIDISQFNRGIADSERFKQGDLSPRLEDFKESGAPSENSDIILALFDPVRYKVFDYKGYDIRKFMDQKTASSRYRALFVLKNTYGEADVSVSLNFIGECGIFKEIKKAEELNKNPEMYKEYTMV